MSISKKIRFEIFKRDAFTCAYCGKTPPSIVLEVDHINPKSKGGNDDINNLIAACFDCNRGKSDIPLSVIPNKLKKNLEVLQEQEEQLKQYNAFLKKITRRANQSIEKVNDSFQAAFPDRMFTDTFKVQIKNFLHQLPEHEVIDAMEIACTRGFDASRALRYFCGVCWRKIKKDSPYGLPGGQQ